MSASREQPDCSAPQGPPPAVRWRSWPLRDGPATATAVLLGLAAAGVGVWRLTGQIHLALLAVAALALAMWRFFVPVSFELNTEGVSHWLFGRHRRVSWKEIRSFRVCSSGVLLLPRADPCPLDAFRGLYLPWGKHPDEVMAQVRYYVDRPPGTY